MPQYSYHCRDCSGDFSIFASMNDKRENIICNDCRSSNVFRVFSRILTKAGGFSKDSSSPPVSSTSSGGCGTCATHSCGTCG